MGSVWDWGAQSGTGGLRCPNEDSGIMMRAKGGSGQRQVSPGGGVGSAIAGFLGSVQLGRTQHSSRGRDPGLRH